MELDNVSFIKMNTSKSKWKVLFSCHPADKDKFFEIITSEILSIVDVSLYYSCDSTNYNIDIEDYCAQLGEFDLIIFPVSYIFLKNRNNSRDLDFKYSLKNNQLVLPILVEENLYEMFNNYKPYEGYKPIQCLDRTANDISQETYLKKLERYLKTIIIDNDIVERIKQSFDVYIFLSYRKKDRKYVKEIMSFLHSIDKMYW